MGYFSRFRDKLRVHDIALGIEWHKKSELSDQRARKVGF